MDEPPTITDPRSLRALAHPIRLALLEVLGVLGTATATRCAELTGESVASCSFHLRTLAEYGFIERAPSHTREKPWRLAKPVQSVDTATENTPMGNALTEVFLEKEFSRLRAWRRRVESEPEDWQAASLVLGATLWMTSTELAEFREFIRSMIVGYLDRVEKAELRPEGARPVRLFMASSAERPPDTAGPAGLR
ncbi:ArsR/SmtB family transcription factor [Streptosporangium carneum]|uniref:Transcriptional regulator n=1 Tax=Streptosporangium carneum TaxID=47481 RepID=A0A9W6I5G7_9ACTN|nr:helix-turn-helix domain-containing protein [Streptosporangium carneum]GLK11314.1 transcriptional regulator [Streptosporangium carneum]